MLSVHAATVRPHRGEREGEGGEEGGGGEGRGGVPRRSQSKTLVDVFFAVANQEECVQLSIFSGMYFERYLVPSWVRLELNTATKPRRLESHLLL